MFNAFKPPKSTITPYSPLKQQRSMDEIKREVSPTGGPLTVNPLVKAPAPQPVAKPIAVTNPQAFMKLRAMFAKGQ